MAEITISPPDKLQGLISNIIREVRNIENIRKSIKSRNQIRNRNENLSPNASASKIVCSHQVSE